MTRRDYVLLSGALQTAHTIAAGNVSAEFVAGVDYASLVLANVLQAKNPKFDRERFLRDAGAVRYIPTEAML